MLLYIHVSLRIFLENKGTLRKETKNKRRNEDESVFQFVTIETTRVFAATRSWPVNLPWRTFVKISVDRVSVVCNALVEYVAAF